MLSDYPLWWLLKVGDKVKLIQYQWENYGTKLDLPPEPNLPVIPHVVEEIDSELERMMRQPPRAVGRGRY